MHFGSETHDAFFKILSKKQPMYVCLVDGCPETFLHDDKRTRHLIQVHQYPESFSFQQRRKQKGEVKPGKRAAGVKGDEQQPEVNAETFKKREARKRRRQQKKKKKLVEQAKLQDSDMQVDAGADAQDADGGISNGATESEVTDVDMDGLEESMRDLRIPKTIHFGRKRRV